MRNLLQYPVTFEEKVDLLNELINKWLKEIEQTVAVGDMTGSILEAILVDVCALDAYYCS